VLAYVTVNSPVSFNLSNSVSPVETLVVSKLVASPSKIKFTILVIGFVNISFAFSK
jgi:hypothetical protein